MDTQPSPIRINFLRQQAAKGLNISSTKIANTAKNRIIDGFVKAPSGPAAVKKTTVGANHHDNGDSAVHPKRDLNSPAHSLHRRADKAHTLMRDALKKPDGLGSRIQTLAPGHNPQRELRAKKIAKHSRVDHFGAPINPSADNPRQIIRGKVTRHHQTSATNASASTAVTMPSMITSASHHRLERMLDIALTHADAHKQALKYQAARHFWQRPGFLGKRPLLKIAAVLIVVLGVGAYFAWRELPAVSVRLASTRAHISASVPAYRPDGYSVAGPASIKNGAVLIKYNAPNNQQGFDITQKPSNMTSTSVSQSLVPAGTPVQTSQVNGSTVYIYGANNNAAWVNNGVLYTITDHSKLSSDQILNIVGGLN